MDPESAAIAQDFCEDVLSMIANMHDLISEAFNKKIIDVGAGVISLANIGISGYRALYGDNYVVESFVENSYPEWDRILQREKDYFINNAFDLFKKIPNSNEYIEKFKKVLVSPICRPADEDMIWDFTFTFVRRSLKFIHQMRKVSPTYQHFVDVRGYASKFNLILS